MRLNYILPYQIAEAFVPRCVDSDNEGRDALVAIAALTISEMMHPALHFSGSRRHPFFGLRPAAREQADD